VGLANIKAALLAGVNFTFGDALLTAAGTTTINSSGFSVPTNPAAVACRARKSIRKAQGEGGGTIFTTEIIILSTGLASAPQEGNAIVLDGATYTLGKSRQDGLESHWVFEVVDG